jgi:Ca2+-transporting ATPase
VLSIVPVLFKLPLILLPVHIAFLHLIIEPASTTLFEALPEDENLMRQKPHTKDAQLLTKEELVRSLLSGVILSFAALGAYLWGIHKNLSAEDVRGITFATLILSNLFLIYTKRGKKNLRENQKHFRILTASTIGLLLVVFYIPFFRELFRFEFLHLHDLLPTIAISLVAGGLIDGLNRMVKKYSTY